MIFEILSGWITTAVLIAYLAITPVYCLLEGGAAIYLFYASEHRIDFRGKGYRPHCIEYWALVCGPGFLFWAVVMQAWLGPTPDDLTLVDVGQCILIGFYKLGMWLTPVMLLMCLLFVGYWAVRYGSRIWDKVKDL